MSIRFGISTIGSTQPRFVRCLKFDWTLDAICRLPPLSAGPLCLQFVKARDRPRAVAESRRAEGPESGSEKRGASDRPDPSLHFDLGAGCFELLLDVVGFVLADAFLDRLGRAFHEVLGFLEAEGRDLAHCLDHVDLAGACVGENDVEFRLLFDSSSTTA